MKGSQFYSVKEAGLHMRRRDRNFFLLKDAKRSSMSPVVFIGIHYPSTSKNGRGGYMRNIEV